MKVFAISDLHLSTNCDKPMDVFGAAWDNYIDKIIFSWNSKVNEEDAVLLCGDLSWGMKLEDAKADIDIIKALKGKKIMIKGNHDYWFSSIGKVRTLLDENFFAVMHDCVKIENFIFCGSRGWTVPEGNAELAPEDQKIYLREAERLKLSFSCVNKIRKENDKVICLMHFPPFDSRRGDSLFTSIIENNKTDKVVYGHLHGKDCRGDIKTVKNGIEYFLTSCDLLKHELIQIM